MKFKNSIVGLIIYTISCFPSFSIEPDIFVQSTVNRASSLLSKDISKDEKIDKLNILQASLLAMVNAVSKLNVTPNHVLIDGNKIPEQLGGMATAIVKGDSKVASIAAASIIAKVTRDRLMRDLDSDFPVYEWAKNSGYPTKCHMNAILKYGITPHHRRSFKPIHKILCG